LNAIQSVVSAVFIVKIREFKRGLAPRYSSLLLSNNVHGKQFFFFKKNYNFINIGDAVVEKLWG